MVRTLASSNFKVNDHNVLNHSTVTEYHAGTNTYLVGQCNPYILVDSAEGMPEYIPLLEGVLNDNANAFRPEEAEISDIIITHRHLDHTGGLPSVLALLQKRWTERHSASRPFPAPRIHKFPHAHPESDEVFDSLCGGHFEPTDADDVSHPLHDGQKFPITALAGADTTDMYLEIVHVPGHTPDSVCIYMPADKAFFTGDTVLGHGSTVFEDMYTYMDSLDKMIRFCGKSEPKYTQLYPGHGHVVPHTHVEMYKRHRTDREKQILGVLEKEPPNGEDYWTTILIVKDMHKGYPPSLCTAAAQAADQHLRKLEAEGRVTPVGGRGHHLAWEYFG